MDGEPVPMSVISSETDLPGPELLVPPTLDLSDAPRVPEEDLRDADGRFKDNLILVSASGRYNGPLRNYDDHQINEIGRMYSRESDDMRRDHLLGQLIRSGKFNLCSEDYVVVDRSTDEGKAYLSRGMSAPER